MESARLQVRNDEHAAHDDGDGGGAAADDDDDVDGALVHICLSFLHPSLRKVSSTETDSFRGRRRNCS